MKEVIDKHSKRSIQIEVIDPVTITTKQFIALTSSFTTYLVKIETDHWAFSDHHTEVRRRYSEFCWLRSKLLCHHPNKTCPPLPAKRFFHITKFDPKNIEDRCTGLEIFLQRVLRSTVYQSDAALHLFLQTNLSISQIEDKLNEEIQPTPVKRIHTTIQREILSSSRKGFRRSCSTSSRSSSTESDRTSVSSGLDSDLTEENNTFSSPDVSHRIKIILKNSTIVPGYVELNTQARCEEESDSD